MNSEVNQDIAHSQETKQSEPLLTGKKQSQSQEQSTGELLSISDNFEIKIGEGNIVLFKKGTTNAYGYYSSIKGLYQGLMKIELFESNGNVEALAEMFNSHFKYLEKIILLINKNEKEDGKKAALKKAGKTKG